MTKSSAPKIGIGCQLLSKNESETTMELFITDVLGLQSGQKVSLFVIENNTEETILDQFEVTLSKEKNHWIFKDLKDARPSDHPARNDQYALTDYMYLKISSHADPVVILLDPVENKLDSVKLYRVSIKIKQDTKPISTVMSPIMIWGTESYQQGLQSLQGSFLASLLPTDIQSTTKTDSYQRSYQSQMTEQLKGLDEYIDELLKNPDSAFLVHFKQMRQYQLLVKELKKFNDFLKREDPSDPYYSGALVQIQMIQHQMEEMEKEAHRYFDIRTGIPKSYQEQVKRNQEYKKRCQEIDAIADTPFCQIICCLPLGGLVSGGLEMLKGNYLKGLACASLDLLTYGGFSKVQKVSRLYKSLSNTGARTARSQIFQARYMHLLMAGGSKNALRLKDLAKNFSIEGAQFLGGLNAIDGFVGSVKDIKTLFSNKRLFANSLKFAQRPGYRDWLKNSIANHNEMLAWGFLRSTIKGYGLVEFGMSLQQKKEAGQKALQRLQTDLPKIQNLLPQEEWIWLQQTVQDDFPDVEPDFFVNDEGGLLDTGKKYGRDFNQEWEDHIIQQQKKEKATKFPSMKSPEELRNDLKILEELWEKREDEFKRFCGKKLNPKNKASYESYITGSLCLCDQDLSQALNAFLSHLEGALKLITPQRMFNSLADARGNLNMHRVYVRHSKEFSRISYRFNLGFNTFKEAALHNIMEMDA